jgi:cytochrome c oxidase assembly factor CtaG
VRSAWRTATEPAVAWSVHAVALWVWHAPPLFQRTLDSHLAHTLQHASFLGSALLFWWALAHSRRRGMGLGGAVLYTFTTAAHTGALGALLTFAPTLWYPVYGDTTAWGLTPLEDQQLAGLIMWIPAGIVYVLAALMLSAQWLRDSEWRTIQRERGALLGQS